MPLTGDAKVNDEQPLPSAQAIPTLQRRDDRSLHDA
jgi:hypothetical protein